MNIRFFDINRSDQNMVHDIHLAILNCAGRGQFINGPEVNQFEEQFADYVGAKYCVGVSSGTAALRLALLAIQEHQEISYPTVAVPSHTFLSTPAAILTTGGSPLFVDSLMSTHQMDTSLISYNAAQIIIPVHLYGNCVDMNKINKDAIVIEDACQAHGTKYFGKHVGTFGQIGCFSFYPTKNLGCYGEGGAVVTNSLELAGLVRVLRNIGCQVKNNALVAADNNRLDTLQAAILLAKMPYLDEKIGQRRLIASWYMDNLLEEIVPKITDGCNPSYHLFVVQVPSHIRDDLQGILSRHGVETGNHYPIPCHEQLAFSQYATSLNDELENASEISISTISLPMFPGLTLHEVEYICEEFNHAYQDLIAL